MNYNWVVGKSHVLVIKSSNIYVLDKASFKLLEEHQIDTIYKNFVAAELEKFKGVDESTLSDNDIVKLNTLEKQNFSTSYYNSNSMFNSLGSSFRNSARPTFPSKTCNFKHFEFGDREYFIHQVRNQLGIF
jgi:hypothetical protein